MNSDQKVILITGASSGIGLACAEYLAARGNIVYGIGRNQGFTSMHFFYYSADITNEASIVRIVADILQKEKRIDLLINNAGIHVLGAVEHISHRIAQHLFECNFFGSLNMIRTILPSMKQRRRGLIICISSLAGISGLPFQGIYCASKFAIEGLSESLRMETDRSGVQIVLLEPGDFRTPITRNRIKDPQTGIDPYYEKKFKETSKKITADENNGMDPLSIAKKVEKIMHLKRPALRYTAGKPIQRLVPILRRILPSAFFQYLIRKNYYA
ncbi:MAG TPA: SDR family oxidoreductase [Chitinophagaceae bacterium]